MHEQAVKTLKNVRTKLAQRLATLVNTSGQQLIEASQRDEDPLAQVPGLMHITNSIFRIDGAIACLQGSVTGIAANGGRNGVDSNHAPHSNHSASPEGYLAEFADLVEQNQIEIASRLLSKVLRLSLDRAATATRFYARACRQNPNVQTDLRHLCEQIRTEAPAQCMRLLVTTLGLQAVESEQAIRSLRGQPLTLANRVPMM